jgi:hypothetical protein
MLVAARSSCDFADRRRPRSNDARRLASAAVEHVVAQECLLGSLGRAEADVRFLWILVTAPVQGQPRNRLGDGAGPEPALVEDQLGRGPRPERHVARALDGGDQRGRGRAERTRPIVT